MRLLYRLCVRDQHLLQLVGTGGPPVRVDIAPSSSTPPALCVAVIMRHVIDLLYLHPDCISIQHPYIWC
jgi:hypothetical protein